MIIIHDTDDSECFLQVNKTFRNFQTIVLKFTIDTRSKLNVF